MPIHTATAVLHVVTNHHSPAVSFSSCSFTVNAVAAAAAAAGVTLAVVSQTKESLPVFFLPVLRAATVKGIIQECRNLAVVCGNRDCSHTIITATAVQLRC